MAVENKYVDSNIVAGKNTNPAFSQGAQMFGAVSTFEVAAADSDGSVYRLFKGVPGDLILIQAKLACDAITGATDYDLGLYETNLGAVVDKDCFADGVDISAGYAFGSEKDMLITLDVANIQKRIYEVGGHTIVTRKHSYDIALTANTVGSAAGTVSVRALFLQA